MKNMKHSLMGSCAILNGANLKIDDIIYKNNYLYLSSKYNSNYVLLKNNDNSEKMDLSLIFNKDDAKFNIQYEEKIKDLSEFIIKLPQTALEDFSWLSDTKLRISLVLAENRSGAIGKASIAGHWLAKKEFSIGKIKYVILI